MSKVLPDNDSVSCLSTVKPAASLLTTDGYGCPECAAEAREGKLKSEQAKTVGGRKVLHQLRSLPPTLSDAEFRKQVLELLNN